VTGKIRVLIIEDNPLDIEIMSEILTRYDLDINFVSSGDEGLKRLRVNHYDAVVSDFAMPGMTGIDVLNQMKSGGCEIPLIIVTGAGNEEIAVEAMKKGAYDYIVKSPDPGYIEILYLVIKQSVERHRMITEKKKLEKKIQILVQAIDNSADGIIIVDKNRNITSWNKGAESIFGYKAHEVMGKSINIIIPKDLQEEADDLIQSIKEKGFIKDYETFRLTKGGNRIPISATLNAIREGGEITAYIGIFRDITAKKKTEEEIKFLYEQARNLADRDPLTGLLNHRRINELLEYEIERSKRRREVFSIMMLDVDNLKLINDTHGHIVGDEVLKNVATILKNCSRSVDSIGRYGGDEFLIILPYTDREKTKAVAERISKHIRRQGLRINEKINIPIRLSIGVATHPFDSILPRELISLADQSMYESKRSGRNVVSINR